jgi:inhibitor of KinA
MSTPPPYRIYPCGDHAVTIEFGDAINIAINEKVISVFSALKKEKMAGVLDIIPSYHTVTVVYDISKLKRQHPSNSVYEMMRGRLQELAAASLASDPAENRLIKIPVCYDPPLGPDLTSLAALHQLSVDEVVQLHTATTYRVYMIGFLPGFAYMGTVNEKLITARKESPRTIVPKGSVGIAGAQTGIYPFDSPGGWQLIGQTPLNMFSAGKEQPCYLQPGDSVQFYAVSLKEFKKLQTA